MRDTDPDIEVLEVGVSLREQVAVVLGTTDAAVIDAAVHDYRGVFADVDAFIRDQLGEHLPRHLQWLPACCEPARLRAGYERGLVRLWTIPLPDGRSLVFESRRGQGCDRPPA